MGILIGLISGIISSMGMGGGTVLIFLLTIFMGMDQHSAQATNLFFFIPTALATILVNTKKEHIDFKVAIIISIFGIIGAVIGARFSIQTDVDLLRKGFGLFLAIIAIHEIYTIIKKYIKKHKNQI